MPEGAARERTDSEAELPLAEELPERQSPHPEERASGDVRQGETAGAERESVSGGEGDGGVDGLPPEADPPEPGRYTA